MTNAATIPKVSAIEGGRNLARRTPLLAMRNLRKSYGGPQAAATGAEGLALVRTGKAIDFTGAGQDLKFDDRGELLGRPFLHQVVPDGKDVIVGIVGGGDAT